MKQIKNLTAAEILKQIKRTVICGEKITETTVGDSYGSTWLEQFNASNPYEAFTPESREYFQHKLFVAFAIGMLPAEVTETRTNEVGPDGCWVFAVETSGTLNPYEETEEETEETAAPTEDQTTENEEEEEEEKTMFNNYIEAVTEDAAQYIRDNYTAEEIAEAMTDRDEFAERLNDEMWIADEVTGNGSGSYTCDSNQAKEYVLADPDHVLEAVREFCCGMDAAELMQKLFNGDWEYFDVTARCYVLGQAIDAALDIIEAQEVA